MAGSTEPRVDGVDTLPPSLRIILNRILEGEQRERFGAFFLSAADAIRALGELDLARYQIDRLDTMDLALWEALAPAVKDTLNAVNIFLRTVLTRFPEPESHSDVGVDDAFDDLFGDDGFGSDAPDSARGQEQDDGGERTTEEQIREAEDVLRAISAGLAQEVTNFGEGLRNPIVMGDRWKLLDYVAQFRGKFRAGVGEMVFLAARVFAAVRREDVVPFYREDTESSVVLRREVTLTGRRIRQLQASILAQDQEEQRFNWVLRLLGTLEDFMRLPAYFVMREADKRALLQARDDLQAICEASPESTPASAVERAIEGLAKFFDSLGVMNRRELLIVHDRDAIKRADRRLLAVERAVLADVVVEGREALREAAEAARSMLGRDADLDDLLLVLAHVRVDAMDADTLACASAMLRARLRAVPGL